MGDATRSRAHSTPSEPAGQTDLAEPLRQGVKAPIQRRTVIKGAIWTTPVVMAAVAAPAMAASPQPGLQGLVQITKSCAGSAMTLTINGTGSYPTRGLWVFNAQPASISNASITFYYPSSLGTIVWSATGSNSGWTAPLLDVTAPTISGYTGYTTRYTGSWTYVSGNNPPYSYATGQPNFTATVNNTSLCGTDQLGVYARRTVTVDGQTITFQRGPVNF